MQTNKMPVHGGNKSQQEPNGPSPLPTAAPPPQRSRMQRPTPQWGASPSFQAHPQTATARSAEEDTTQIKTCDSTSQGPTQPRNKTTDERVAEVPWCCGPHACPPRGVDCMASSALLSTAYKITTRRQRRTPTSLHGGRTEPTKPEQVADPPTTAYMQTPGKDPNLQSTGRQKELPPTPDKQATLDSVPHTSVQCHFVHPLAQKPRIHKTTPTPWRT